MAVLLIALILRGITAVAVLRQDEQAGTAAIAGYEAATGVTDVSVEHLERYGRCAVADLDSREGITLVALTRDDEGWHLKGVVRGRADVSDVSDLDDCLEATRNAG